jgi:long-chain acyl-CoA synthetase
MVRARISSASLINRLAFRVLMPVGYQMAESAYKKQKPGLLRRIICRLADITFFAPIRRSLGLQNARICYTTGAILSPDAFKFYHALNLPLKNLYGSTEGGPLTGPNNDDILLETVGPAHKGTEVKITDNGEIIYREPGTFVGYYKDPDKTAQVLKDGWFYSGDSGFIRNDGHIVFVDKVKDVVRLASGETLAPQLIESRLRSSPYIKDAWILAGPEGLYASAIIVIDYNNVGKWAGERRLAYSTFMELAQRPEVYELIKHDIERVNRTLSDGSRVIKYVNLHREFDPDEGELTRTRKLRRGFLEVRYRELIEAIYSDKTGVSSDALVGSNDGRTGTAATTLRIESLGGAD